MSRLFARSVFFLYRTLGRLAGPLVWLLLQLRLRRGKEEPTGLIERWGHGCGARPPGALIWVHAASVGESLAILPLVERLHEAAETTTILMTSTTVTSARLLGERLPAGVLHRFSPVDLPRAIERFLDHWRPDLAIYVESELWPTQLWALDRRRITRVLVNGRMSSRSYRGWRRYPGLATHLLGGFALVAAESARSAERLTALGAPKVVATGNLKQAAQPLPADESALRFLRAALDGRPCWLAASTHPGEEVQVFAAHRLLRKALPNLLTILVPRHPARGAEIAALATAEDLRLARRSLDQLPDAQSQVYLADTLGELGLFYRLAPLVFVGGSLVPVGGHNPLEPARLAAALLCGPHQDNVTEACQRLIDAGALRVVEDADRLAEAGLDLLRDPDALAKAGQAALAVGQAEAAVLDRCWTLLQPLLPVPELSAEGGNRPPARP
ncbi:MAG: 3-deoxy-D-manno-octulosonic acid transferase [Rhodospirillales bacterium]